MKASSHSARGVLVFVVTILLAPLPVQAGECGRLCDGEFWRSATPADVQAELAKGSDPQARDERGMTPLHQAARFNDNPAVVTVLLEVEADLKVRARMVLMAGQTPLHLAAWANSNPTVVTVLLGAGSEREARTERGWTPLHRAALNENPAIVTVLLDAGAVLEARTENGSTPLHKAAVNGNPAVVITLLDAGADPKAKTTDGKTAFDLAQKNDKLKGTDAYWRLNDLRFE